MRKSIRYAVRFVVIITVVGALSLLLAPSSPTSTPYLSALLNLVAGSTVIASPTCENKSCNLSTGKCVHNPGQNCRVHGNQCVGTISCL